MMKFKKAEKRKFRTNFLKQSINENLIKFFFKIEFEKFFSKFPYKNFRIKVFRFCELNFLVVCFSAGLPLHFLHLKEFSKAKNHESMAIDNDDHH